MDLKEAYRILEIPKTDSIKEVKQGYRDIVFVWHPDRLGSNERIQKKAENKLKQINEAYEVLKYHLLSKPPELVEIFIVPDKVELNPNDSYSFSVFGIDSEGNQVEVEQVTWDSLGGVIYQDGLFFAEDIEDNEALIIANVDGLEAVATVFVNEKVLISNEIEEDSNVDSYSKEEETNNENIGNNNTSVTQEKQTQNIIVSILVSTVKWTIWGFITWGFITAEYDDPTPFIDKIGILSLFSWIVGLIIPSAVIRFGLPNNRRVVSQLYTTLTAFCFGGLSALNPETREWGLIEDWILGSSIFLIIAILLYPRGTILGDLLDEDPEQNRASLGCGCLFTALILIGIVAGFKAVF